MARKSVSLYQVIFPIRSDSIVLDDIPGLDRQDEYPMQIGDVFTISDFLDCSEHSVVTCAKQGHRLRGCKINIWQRYFECTPYAVSNVKTGKLKSFNGTDIFTLEKMAKVLNYSESYIANAAIHPNVGKRTFGDERVVKIANAKIRHYVNFGGKECDFYMFNINGDDKEYMLHYE